MLPWKFNCNVSISPRDVFVSPALKFLSIRERLGKNYSKTLKNHFFVTVKHKIRMKGIETMEKSFSSDAT